MSASEMDPKPSTGESRSAEPFPVLRSALFVSYCVLLSCNHSMLLAWARTEQLAGALAELLKRADRFRHFVNRAIEVGWLPRGQRRRDRRRRFAALFDPRESDVRERGLGGCRRAHHAEIGRERRHPEFVDERFDLERRRFDRAQIAALDRRLERDLARRDGVRSRTGERVGGATTIAPQAAIFSRKSREMCDESLEGGIETTRRDPFVGGMRRVERCSDGSGLDGVAGARVVLMVLWKHARRRVVL